jgi:RNA polymerase sigma-70 factor (sigma-E family)
MSYDDFLSARLRDLLRLAIALCGERALGEDVLQEVLLRAHQQWSRIGLANSPYAYVRTMLVHEHLAQIRKRGRQIPRAEIDTGQTTPDPAVRIVERDDLLGRLDTLPAQQRAAIVLRYLSGMADDEIARNLDCSAVTVRSYISRGLAAMRVQLAAELTAARKDA